MWSRSRGWLWERWLRCSGRSWRGEHMVLAASCWPLNCGVLTTKQGMPFWFVTLNDWLTICRESKPMCCFLTTAYGDRLTGMQQVTLESYLFWWQSFLGVHHTRQMSLAAGFVSVKLEVDMVAAVPDVLDGGGRDPLGAELRPLPGRRAQWAKV